jgi:hypothetical protein
LLLVSLTVLLAVFFPFLFALERDYTLTGELSDDAFLTALVGMVGLAGLVGAVVLLRQHQRDVPRIVARKRLGKLLGLEYRTRITFGELEPFFGLPLFCFAWSSLLRGGFSLHGRIDTQEVWMFDLVYSTMVRTRGRGCLPYQAWQTMVLFPVPAGAPSFRPDQKASHATGVCLPDQAVQAEWVLPAARDLPDFRFGPANSDWERLVPSGPALVDAGQWILDINEGPQMTRLFGKDVAEVRRLFSPECLAELGNLAGWVVECRSGDLLVYHFGAPAAASEVQTYLERALAIRRALTRPERPDAEDAECRPEPLRTPPGPWGRL